ncbi:hypothetical protein B1H39_24120 [Serratia marcescens]|uniref:hypothetical protein n=1 Tax=Serratia marcescens TaxID=615 RepID=UPI0009A5299A|nr:hypothetical protein [Serratia marcescens]OPJ90881.1 hypothetical protein B1H39_24120 [Serratia marcescens]
MLIYISDGFYEFPHGDYIAHRFDFKIDDQQFLVIFAEINTNDLGYHAYRCEEVGFNIPSRCYDVKFDRLENFENETFYQPPSPEAVCWRLDFSRELAEALETVITLHHNIYQARAYIAVAETKKLKRFYDRVLQTIPDDVIYEYRAELGEGGLGYALKTRYFNL